jgi:hypothetical protein
MRTLVHISCDVPNFSFIYEAYFTKMDRLESFICYANSPLYARLSVAVFSILNPLLCLAACPRPVLQSALENLLKTIENPKESSLTIASKIKISNNNVVVGSIKETGFSNFARWAKLFRIDVLDEGTCDVAALSIPKFGNQI